MNVARIPLIGLPDGIGIKVFRAGREILFFRMDPETGISEEILSREKVTLDAIIQRLAVEQSVGSQLFVFQCCCALCSTPQHKLAGKLFSQIVGAQITHGWWPECAQLEKERFDLEKI